MLGIPLSGASLFSSGGVSSTFVGASSAWAWSASMSFGASSAGGSLGGLSSGGGVDSSASGAGLSPSSFASVVVSLEVSSTSGGGVVASVAPDEV